MHRRRHSIAGRIGLLTLSCVLMLGTAALATEYGLNPDGARNGHVFDEFRGKIYLYLDGLYANCDVTSSEDLEDEVTGVVHGRLFKATDSLTGTRVELVVEFPDGVTEVNPGDPYSLEASGPSIGGVHSETGVVDDLP